MKKYIITTIGVMMFTLVASAQTPSNYAFSNDLTLGSSGPDVVQLQTWLINNGYSIPSVSSGATSKGYFGQQTQGALISYQRTVGLPAYGFFGPLTRQYLNKGGGNGGGNYNSAPFKITRPNGGESWLKGTTQNITWTSPAYFMATYVDIRLVPYQQPCVSQICPMIAQLVRAPYTIVTSIPINQNSYSWNVGGVQMIGCPGQANMYHNPDGSSYCAGTAPDGQYTIQICQTGTSVCTSSASPFTIYSNGQTTSAISVLSPNGGEVWNIGENRVISWTTNYSSGSSNYYPAYNQSYDIYLVTQACAYGQTCLVSSTAPQLLARSITGTSYNWSVGTTMSNTAVTASYKIEICQSGSMTVCGMSNAPFTINSSAYSSTPDINVVSPSSGQVWMMGTGNTISFNITGDPSRIGNNITAFLVNANNQQTYLGSFTPSIGAGLKTFNVSVPSNVSSGSYRLLVNLYQNSQLQAYDYSDYFTVTSGLMLQNNNFYTPYSTACPAGYSCVQNAQ